MGGMMTIPKGQPIPPMWLLLHGNTQSRHCARAGDKEWCQVMNGPMDVPGGGRIAQLMDPQGAAFALHQAPKKAA